MKTQKFLSVAAVAAALFSTGALAQPAGTAAPNVAPDTPTPSQFVYVAKVPTPAELQSRAASQGVAIERVDQTANGTIVVYKYRNGATSTVAYSAMPAGDEAAVAGVPAQAAPEVAPAPTTTVVYDNYGYGPYYPYYWGGWYPPVSVGIGFGWGWHGGWRGGGWHGGGWHGGGGHGGWRR